MPITFKCPHCGRALLARDELGMTSRRCSGCGQVVEVPTAAAPVVPQGGHTETMSPSAAIESGHLDQFAELLAEHHHTAKQRKLDAGRVWGVFVMSPSEVVDFVREYQNKFDAYVEDAPFPHGRALCVLLFPRQRDHGCVCLTGLALPTNLQAWLAEHGSIPPQDFRVEKSPMDGRAIVLDFVGGVRKEARRPNQPKASPDGISMMFRERLYMFGWNRQEAEMMYFGAHAASLTAKAAAKAEAGPSAPRRVLRSPRELALLERIFACATGARQVGEAEGGVAALLAAPDCSRVFAAELCDLLGQCNDAHLRGAFGGLDLSAIPMNDNCAKYYQKPDGLSPTLAGPDPRMITLTFALAALAESGRMAPAETLALKIIPRFTEKCRRGQAQDKSDEWHIGRWGRAYYTAAAAIVMKEAVERYAWALPILDAVVVEYHHAEEALYWRAMAAYKYWLLKPDRPNRIHMANLRLRSILAAAQKEPMDPARMETIRQCLARMAETH